MSALLQAGDTVTIKVEGVGELTNPVALAVDLRAEASGSGLGTRGSGLLGLADSGTENEHGVGEKEQ